MRKLLFFCSVLVTICSAHADALVSGGLYLVIIDSGLEVRTAEIEILPGRKSALPLLETGVRLDGVELSAAEELIRKLYREAEIYRRPSVMIRTLRVPAPSPEIEEKKSDPIQNAIKPAGAGKKSKGWLIW
ncbi:MAG: hypothetical protein PHQ23_00630 [Candidatus Wallbacteria bacterium]|nr:hypothetical protein [Candidatus Wallbacteria bacterium]